MSLDDLGDCQDLVAMVLLVQWSELFLVFGGGGTAFHDLLNP